MLHEAPDGRQDVRLRRYTIEDADWYAQTTRDPEIQQFTSERPGLTAEDVAVAIAESGPDPGQEAFLIVGDADADRLGNLAIQVSREDAELSYWVSAQTCGRGVATRAILVACEWLRDHSSVETARLWTTADNLASRRAAEQAGFRLVARSHRRLRDRLVESAEYERTV